jgi:hypothetical protein
MPKRDPFEDPQWKAYAQRFIRDVAPHIVDSAYFTVIAPPGGRETDVKQAVEIGYALLMDKPIIVVHAPNRPMPAKLRKVADHIVVGDITTDVGRIMIADQMKAIFDADETDGTFKRKRPQ